MNFSESKTPKPKYKPIVLSKTRNLPAELPQEASRNVFFRHSANAGDLIYSLVAIRQAARMEGKRAVIYQLLNEPCKYWGAEHPIGDVMFNEYMLRICKPLVEAQDYVESLVEWDCHQVQFNIDLLREVDTSKALGLPYGDIRQWVMMLYPELQSCIGEPWITIPQVPQTDIILVNRTARYRNKSIRYEFLQDYDMPIGFIGVKQEYKEFQKEVPRAEYIRTNDLLQAAKVIKGSKIFIGNQSVCFAIAEGMGAPRILEVCPEAPNVIPSTPNGYLFRDQKGFEHLVKLKTA